MKTTLSIISFLLTTAACFAEWHLIDDFEAYNNLDVFNSAEDIGWEGLSTLGGERFRILEIPENSGNLGLIIEGGGDEISEPGELWCTKEIPNGGIAPGETGTLFIRHYCWEGGGESLCWGTTASQLEPELFFSAHSVLAEFNASAIVQLPTNSEPFQLKYSDGETWETGNPSYLIENFTWNNIWMVVRNTFDGQTSTGTFSIYAQGPQDPNPKLVTTGESGNKTQADFRRGPVGEEGTLLNISKVILYTNSYHHYFFHEDPGYSLLDDIYFTSGENLSNPIVYGGYPADGSRDTDTGDFLGWINITQAPYIWSYSLNGWIYMEEPAADAPGAWGYFFK